MRKKIFYTNHFVIFVLLFSLSVLLSELMCMPGGGAFTFAATRLEEEILEENQDNGEESVSGSADGSQLADAGDAESKDYEIYVNIPSFTLRLISGGVCEKKYKIRVGKPASKTITGIGSITRKFKTSYFRYASGPQQGEIIRYSNIRSSYNGKIVKRIKIPYDKIRGLELEINGEVTGQIIHATTNPETLGHACSSGCVGMSIEDMLDLYGRKKPGTKVLIEYNPVEYHDGIFYFYGDIYKLNPDYSEILEEIFNSYGISYTDDFIKQIIKKGKKEKKVSISDVYGEMREKLAFEDVSVF